MKIYEENVRIFRTGGDENSGHDISEEEWRKIRELEMHRDQLIDIVDRRMKEIIRERQ
jgi:hypothetical protein